MINGETKTGVIIFLVNHEIDTGKILFKHEIEIDENDTFGDLHDRLMEIGSVLVLQTVDALAQGKVQPVTQSELLNLEQIKHAPKLHKENCKIDWSASAEAVRNLIRGLSPYPAAWSIFKHSANESETLIKIFFASKFISDSKASPGIIKSDGESFMRVACGDGWLEITDLQLAGKKRMKIREFLNGFRGIGNYRLE